MNPNGYHLGDGAYVAYEGGSLRLYTWNGLRVTNEIWFGLGELDAFLTWLQRNNMTSRVMEQGHRLRGNSD